MQKCIDGIAATKLDVFGSMKPGRCEKKAHLGKFIKGPLPLNWLSIAAKLGGKSLNLSLALFFKEGFRPSEEIIVSQALLEPFDCGVRQTQYKTLKQLQMSGLVNLRTKKGACPRVTLILEAGKAKGVVDEPD